MANECTTLHRVIAGLGVVTALCLLMLVWVWGLPLPLVPAADIPSAEGRAILGMFPVAAASLPLTIMWMAKRRLKELKAQK